MILVVDWAVKPQHNHPTNFNIVQEHEKPQKDNPYSWSV